jgi:predicted nucleic acid-binding protein
MPAGAKREAVESWYRSSTGPLSLFMDRILPLDANIAEIWADLMIEGRRMGRPRSFTDMIIAATAISHDCQIVTNNERDFWGLDCINPMKTRSVAE